MTDKHLLELAARAAGYNVVQHAPDGSVWCVPRYDSDAYGFWWNPLTDDGDRYRLAKRLGITIDFADCCAWKRLPCGTVIQEWWGGDSFDEPHAIVMVAAALGRAAAAMGSNIKPELDDADNG